MPGAFVCGPACESGGKRRRHGWLRRGFSSRVLPGFILPTSRRRGPILLEPLVALWHGCVVALLLPGGTRGGRPGPSSSSSSWHSRSKNRVRVRASRRWGSDPTCSGSLPCRTCQLCPALSRPVTSLGLESAPHDVVLSAALLLPDPSSSSPFPTASPQRWHSKKAEPWDAPEAPGWLRHTTELYLPCPVPAAEGSAGYGRCRNGAEGTSRASVSLIPPRVYQDPGAELCSVGFGGAEAHCWHRAHKSLVTSRPRGGARGTAVLGGSPFGGVLLGESFWPLFILGQGGGAVPRCEHPLPASWAPLRARNGAVARGLGQLTASPGSAAPALTPPCSSSLCPGSGFLAAT